MLTDDERTRLLGAATRQMDDLFKSLTTARDTTALLLRILPVVLDLLDATRGDLDTLGGLMTRLAKETSTGEEAPRWLMNS